MLGGEADESVAALYEQVLAYQQPAEPDHQVWVRSASQSRRGRNQVICDNARLSQPVGTSASCWSWGIQHTYPWIEEQVRKARAGK